MWPSHFVGGQSLRRALQVKPGVIRPVGAEPSMWRPEQLGNVVATRVLTLRIGEVESSVDLVVGQPVRSPNAEEGEPWWCPIRFGVGPDKLWASAGEDSLQALILALELARKLLPFYAKQAGGTILLDPGDTDVITPNAKLMEFYGEAAGEALKAIRQADRLLRDSEDPALTGIRQELGRLVSKYGDK